MRCGHAAEPLPVASSPHWNATVRTRSLVSILPPPFTNMLSKSTRNVHLRQLSAFKGTQTGLDKLNPRPAAAGLREHGGSGSARSLSRLCGATSSSQVLKEQWCGVERRHFAAGVYGQYFVCLLTTDPETPTWMQCLRLRSLRSNVGRSSTKFLLRIGELTF